MTLVEIMVSTAIGVMVLGAVASLTSYTSYTLGSIANYAIMDGNSRYALDQLTYQIRRMDSLTSITSNSISFTRGGTNYNFVYSPAQQTLSEVTPTATTVLLPNCTAVSFSIYQRNSISNTFDQYPTSVSSNTCKVVQINWNCAMTNFWNWITTETEQSAKVVIRR
jgi:hypothetical protein